MFIELYLQIVNFVVVWVLFLQKSDDISDVIAVHSLYFFCWITHGDNVVSYVCVLTVKEIFHIELKGLKKIFTPQKRGSKAAYY